MKKRLRKKYHLKEFQELCFEIHFLYRGVTNSREENLFWEEFIMECIEKNGLNCGGCISAESWDFTAHSVDKSKTIDYQIGAVKKWLDARCDVEDANCGNLKDLWYGTSISMNDEMQKKPLQYFVQFVRKQAQSLLK
ncbi:MAG: DUF469 family protein [Akkermansia sp.]|nr:DUF469 family protein [Akkermansia sp.]